MGTACILKPDLVLDRGGLSAEASLGIDDQGRLCPPQSLPAAPVIRLAGRAVLPGLVNAHSHAFQRLIRGRTSQGAPAAGRDDFWSWRERMYQAAAALDPEGLYVASRQAFLEMALSGITTVGEFHYLQHQPDGTPYANRGELALQVIRAAREVGLRIVLLRAAYARPGAGEAPNPRQRRFYDRDPQDALGAVEALAAQTAPDPGVTVGLAPHSVRALPRAWLQVMAQERRRPVHMHVAEQPAEIQACLAEHGKRPVELLAELGLLTERFTAVHAIHLTGPERDLLTAQRARVCACPSTERDLGDGVVEADAFQRAGVPLCLGSDSQAQIDLWSEARELEGHLRLLRGRRNVLAAAGAGPDPLGSYLLDCATAQGAAALGVPAGSLVEGGWADLLTLDLQHPGLTGAKWEAAGLLFGATPGAVRDVMVGGRWIVRDGAHPLAQTSGRAFAALAQKVFS